MKRRQFITASAAAPAIALASTEQPKTARYAIVISNAYDRGSVVAFSLPDAIKKVREELNRSARVFEVGYIVCEVVYADGRDSIYIEESDLTRATLSESQARAAIIRNCKGNLKSYNSGKGMYLGPPPDERDAEEWRDVIANGPSDEQVQEYMNTHRRMWLSDAELAEYERNHIA